MSERRAAHYETTATLRDFAVAAAALLRGPTRSRVSSRLPRGSSGRGVRCVRRRGAGTRHVQGGVQRRRGDDADARVGGGEERSEGNACETSGRAQARTLRQRDPRRVLRGDRGVHTISAAHVRRGGSRISWRTSLSLPSVSYSERVVFRVFRFRTFERIAFQTHRTPPPRGSSDRISRRLSRLAARYPPVLAWRPTNRCPPSFACDTWRLPSGVG